MIELKFMDVLFSELSELDNFVKNWNNNVKDLSGMIYYMQVEEYYDTLSIYILWSVCCVL